MSVIGTNRIIVIEAIQRLLMLLFATMETNIVRVVNKSSSEFNAQVDNFKNNIFDIVNKNLIGENLSTLFAAYNDITDSANDLYALNFLLFNFRGEDATVNTAQEVTDALTVAQITIRLMALAYAYEAATKITYNNALELNDNMQQLEAEYDSILENTLDSKTRISILDLKTNAMTYFSSLDLKEIININTPMIPSTVLAYRYYKNSTRSNDIVALNYAYNTSFVVGDNLQILEP
jgi:prophage DNA circulation protein